MAKKAKNLLKKSEQNFRLLFNNHDAVMLLVEPDSGAIINANKAAAGFYGYTQAELYAMNITDINTLPREEVAAERKRAKNEERNYFFFPHRLADGAIRTVEVHSSPIEVQGQRLLFSIVHDITDRKKAEAELQRHHEQLEELVRERTSELETKNRLLTREIAEHKRTEDTLRQSEKWYSLLFENMLDGFAHCRMIFDDNGKPADFVYLSVNTAFERLTGLKSVMGKKVTEAIPGIREAHPELFDIYGRVALTGQSERFEIEFTPLQMWLSVSVYAVEKEQFVAIFENITERKLAQKEQGRLILELQDALSKVKTLSGLLPICSHCKRIRNDNDQWEQMEVYIRDRSEADFSHGICPDCAQKLYPEYYQK